MTRALILGGGGHAANAWQIGIIAGLADAGLDLRQTDLMVGTSAGARVAVQLASEIPLEELYGRQTGMAPDAREGPPGVDWEECRRMVEHARERGGSAADILRRVGAAAQRVAPGTSEQQRELVAAQLPISMWPERNILLTAVEAESGKRRAFGRATGIDLIDAVMASGAVPGVWPPVPFQGLHYFDGGFYSLENADLGRGYDEVTILTLDPGDPPMSAVSLQSGLDELRAGASRVRLIQPDSATQEAFRAAGFRLIDPAVCAPAAQAGREQGRRIGKVGRAFGA